MKIPLALLLLAFLSSVGLFSGVIYGENGILKVTILMKNTSHNIGEYRVLVSVYGTDVLEQSKLVDTSSQLCPDDIESECYKSETFFFPNDSIPDGSKIKACVEEPLSGVQSCEYGINKVENTPEVITIYVPDK